MCQSIHSAVKSSVNNFVTVCAKHPRILWWRFDGDACVENVNMDVRLFSSQCWKSFQFTVLFESKKMLSFAALGLSLDPVNNIWKSGKSGQKIKMYFFVLKILFVSCLFCICSMFGSYKPELAGWGNFLAQHAEDFPRFVKLCLTGCFSKWTINQKRPSSPPAAVWEHKKITYLSKS